jgi:hypothetical protein
MLESEFRSFAELKGFHPQTLTRWLNWREADRGALAKLTLSLKIGENHLRDLMDWSEEISLRDGVAIFSILEGKVIDDIATDPRLGRADKLRRIKEQIRRLRFPRLAKTEDEIGEQIHALKLHPDIRLSVPVGLEGGRLQVEFRVTTATELKRLADKLSAAARTSAAGEIFRLLGGSALNSQRS